VPRRPSGMVSAKRPPMQPSCFATPKSRRHGSHAARTVTPVRRGGAEAGEHVYRGKPLALSEEQLAPTQPRSPIAARPALRCGSGINRRFSQLSRQALAHFDGIDARQVCRTVRSPACRPTAGTRTRRGDGILLATSVTSSI